MLRSDNKLLTDCCGAGSDHDQVESGGIAQASAWKDRLLRATQACLLWSPVSKLWSHVRDMVGFPQYSCVAIKNLHNGASVQATYAIPLPPKKKAFPRYLWTILWTPSI